jgi:hypothetical protein
MLSSRLGRSRATLVLDEPRGRAGIGLAVDGARALVLAGDRAEEVAPTSSKASIEDALRRGARVLVAGGGR